MRMRMLHPALTAGCSPLLPGSVPPQVREDFPHEAGRLRLGAHRGAVPAGGSVPPRERLPAAPRDQALESLSRLSRRGLRAAHPVSGTRRVEGLRGPGDAADRGSRVRPRGSPEDPPRIPRLCFRCDGASVAHTLRAWFLLGFSSVFVLL